VGEKKNPTQRSKEEYPKTDQREGGGEKVCKALKRRKSIEKWHEMGVCERRKKKGYTSREKKKKRYANVWPGRKRKRVKI